MALTAEGVGNAETTIEVVAVMVIAAVIGFIVYEIVQGIQSVENSTSGLFGIGAALLAGILLF
jgi:hypothetical protein